MRTPIDVQRSPVIPHRMLSQIVRPTLGVVQLTYSLGVEFLLTFADFDFWSKFRVLDLGRGKMVLFALSRFNRGLWTREWFGP